MSEQAITQDEIDAIDNEVEGQAKPKTKAKAKKKAPKTIKGWAHGKVIISKSGLYFCATCAMKEVIDQDGEAEEKRIVVVYMAEPDRDFKSPQEYPQTNWSRVKKRNFESVRKEFIKMPLDE